MKKDLSRVLERLICFFRRNPATFLILAFQILLVLCVGILILGNKLLAQDLAVFAFFPLAFGILLQFILLLRARELG